MFWTGGDGEEFDGCLCLDFGMSLMDLWFNRRIKGV